MSTQQFHQQPHKPLTESLITSNNLEHPRSITRRIKACVSLAGAAAGVLALAATSPR
jgi:hypothetical protein